MKKGLVTIITGSGKGKTTSGIGIAIAAASEGKRVFIGFFLKGGQFDHGEFKALQNVPNITFENYGQGGFIDVENITNDHRLQTFQALTSIQESMVKGDYDMVVLDEINMTVAKGIIDIETLVDFIDSKPSEVDLVLTGRKADPRLIEIADKVSEFLMIKHPYSTGQKARKGIDY